MSKIPVLRRSQLITTFGIGAILDTPDYSVMIAGQDYWQGHALDTIREPRLEKSLGPDIKCFKQPRDVNDVEQAVPMFRFPYWHFCPECKDLKPIREWGDIQVTDCRRCSQPKNRKRLIPSRFVIACERGHIEDFPWDFWIRKAGCTCEVPRLKISSTGKSGALSSIVVTCQECGKDRSLDGLFSRHAMAGWKCSGTRPWLNDRVPCDEPVIVLQRGSASVYYPLTASAISIPPYSRSTYRLVEQVATAIYATGEHLAETILRGVAQQSGKPFESLWNAWVQSASLRAATYTPDILREEYIALCDPEDYDASSDFAAKVETVAPKFKSLIERVVLIHRLRVVTALHAFRRVKPSTGKADAPVARSRKDWFPASEVNGEGIFVQLSQTAIDAWKTSGGVALAARAKILDDRRLALKQRGIRATDQPTSPELLLIHTLAHVLLQTLTLSCGYSNSALRERLYVAPAAEGKPPMNGLLIYTASADSEGSLGGLVRQGLQTRFAETLERTLYSVGWCSNDPLCMESPGQGMDSLNLAACHSCSLLPETACELFNCFLDRGVLVGVPQDNIKGFFP